MTDLDNQAHLSVQVQQIRRVSVHRELGLDLVEDGFLGDPVDGEVHFRLVVVATSRGSLYADDVPACADFDVFLELGPVLLVVMARLAHAGAQDPDLVIVVLVYGLDGRGEVEVAAGLHHERVAALETVGEVPKEVVFFFLLLRHGVLVR